MFSRLSLVLCTCSNLPPDILSLSYTHTSVLSAPILLQANNVLFLPMVDCILTDCDSKSELLAFLSESALMKDFDHPHVLGLTGVCLDSPTREPLILLPFMANGDLKSYLRDKRGDSSDAKTFPEVSRLDQW